MKNRSNARAWAGSSEPNIQLYGGDTAASEVWLSKGVNTFSLPSTANRQRSMRVVTLFINALLKIQEFLKLKVFRTVIYYFYNPRITYYPLEA
jgi:hypothetical protein